MKNIALTSIIFLTFASSPMVGSTTNTNSSDFDDLYACVWFPMCDKELTNPLSQPTDTKTETQDAKDEKLA